MKIKGERPALMKGLLKIDGKGVKFVVYGHYVCSQSLKNEKSQ
jgi:hypothetical protein